MLFNCCLLWKISSCTFILTGKWWKNIDFVVWSQLGNRQKANEMYRRAVSAGKCCCVVISHSHQEAKFNICSYVFKLLLLAEYSQENGIRGIVFTVIFAPFHSKHPISAWDPCHRIICQGRPRHCNLPQTCPSCKSVPEL